MDAVDEPIAQCANLTKELEALIVESALNGNTALASAIERSLNPGSRECGRQVPQPTWRTFSTACRSEATWALSYELVSAYGSSARQVYIARLRCDECAVIRVSTDDVLIIHIATGQFVDRNNVKSIASIRRAMRRIIDANKR